MGLTAFFYFSGSFNHLSQVINSCSPVYWPVRDSPFSSKVYFNDQNQCSLHLVHLFQSMFLLTGFKSFLPTVQTLRKVFLFHILPSTCPVSQDLVVVTQNSQLWYHPYLTGVGTKLGRRGVPSTLLQTSLPYEESHLGYPRIPTLNVRSVAWSQIVSRTKVKGTKFS